MIDEQRARASRRRATGTSLSAETPPSLFSGYWNAPGEHEVRVPRRLVRHRRRRERETTPASSGSPGERVISARERLSRRRPGHDPPRASRSHRSSRELEPRRRRRRARARDAYELRVRVRASSGSLLPPTVRRHAGGEPEPAPVDASRDRVPTPLWARLTAASGCSCSGILVGGTAIPHASDGPRIAPQSKPHASAICPAPKS